MNDDDDDMTTDGEEWMLPEGNVLVKCPTCDYTNDVPENKASDGDYISENCERCSIPAVTRIVAGSPFEPFDEATRNRVIEHAVASATRKVVKMAENTNRSDMNLAEIGVMIARETMDTTFHVLAAEEEYRRAAEVVASRREGRDSVGDPAVVALPDGREPSGHGEGAVGASAGTD